MTALEIQFVKHVDDPVLCPKCGEEMLKADRPHSPWPTPIRTGTHIRPGRAYCDNADCEYARKQEFESWAVEPGSVGYEHLEPPQEAFRPGSRGLTSLSS